MDSNKLSDLKAHNQFLLGRIDACNWILANASTMALTDVQQGEIRQYQKRNQASSNEQQRLIDKKNAEATAVLGIWRNDTTA